MGGDKSAYGREVADLVTWCQDNNLSLNVNKTKAMIVDLRWWKEEHCALWDSGRESEQFQIPGCSQR